MKRTRPTLPEGPVDAAIGDSREFLELLAHILHHMGHSPKRMDKQFHEICSSLPEPTRAWNPSYLNFLTALPGVIARWHTDEQFLDSKGLPVALPLRSGSVSLSSLIAHVLPDEDPSVVVDFLIKFQAIRPEGNRYLPTDLQLRFTEQNAWVYGLCALLGILRTIKYNVTRARPSDTIQERVAVSLHFPVRALPAFHRWLKKQAKEFLWGVYRNMSRHESQTGSEPSTRLSVSVFAFEDPMITGTPNASQETRLGKRLPSAGGRRSTRRRGKP